MKRFSIGIVSVIAIMMVGNRYSLAGDAQWTNSGSGSWFDPTNWDTGMAPVQPAAAYIDNGGTAELAASADYNHLPEPIYVGYNHTGTLEQMTGTTGGSDLYLGYQAGSYGVYRIGGSATSNFTDYIGVNGAGLLEQTGGVLNCFRSYVGPQGVQRQSGGTSSFYQFYMGGRYELSGTGLLDSTNGQMTVMPGDFIQTGGTHNASGLAIDGIYDMQGGTAKTHRIILGYNSATNGDIVNLSGGSFDVGNLAMKPSTQFNVSGGTLIVSDSIEPGSSISFATGKWLAFVPSGFADFSSSTFSDIHQASFSSLPGTLTLLPATTDPSQFGSYNPGGLVHVVGSPLTIAAGQTVSGEGTIPDRVVVYGTITSLSQVDALRAYINAANGVEVHAGGSFNLGFGTLTVEDQTSGMDGGTLKAATFYVGKTGTASFIQSGGNFDNGTNTTSWPNIYIGDAAGSNGYYELSGSASIKAGNVYVGSSGAGRFHQRSGGVSLAASTGSTLSVGAGGVYEMEAGTLFASVIDDSGRITQASGDSTTDYLRLSYSGSSGTYNLNGGSLQAFYYEYVGDFGTGAFIQMGGTNSTCGLILGNNGQSGGIYNLNGGLLMLSSLSQGSGSAAFTFSGGTLRAGGSFSTSLPMTLGTGSGATFDTAGFVVTLSGPLSGPGSLTKVDSGTLLLSGSNTYSGGTAVSAGTLQVASTAALPGYATPGKVSLGNGAVLTINAGGGGWTAMGISSLLSSNSGGFASGAIFGIDTSGGSLSCDSTIAGNMGLAKLGSNTLVLTGSNTYAGPTVVTAGTLQVGDGGASGTLGTGPVTDNRVLVFNLSIPTTLGSIISGSGSLTQSGTGILTLLGSSTYSGSTAVSAGTLQIGNGGSGASIGSTSSLLDNGSLVFNHSDPVVFSPRISGIGSLTQAGSGILTLTGTNSYTGGTTIAAGTLVFASSQAIGGSGANVTVNYGGTAAAGYAVNQSFLNRLVTSSSGVAALTTSSSNALSFSGFANLRLGATGTATYSGILTPSGTTYRFGGGGGVLTVSGPLSGANSLDVGANGTLAGTVVLSGTDTYTGPTQVSGGTLVVQGANASSAFTANNGGTLQFSGASINLGNAYVQSMSGGLVQYQNTNMSGGFLRGPGVHVLAARSANTFNATTINTGAVLQQMGSTALLDVTNRGQIINNAPLTWNGGLNDGGATLTVTSTATVSEWNNAGAIVVSSSGLLNNHATDLTSYGGGRITVASGGTLFADSQSEGVALDLQDSLLVNDGTVTGTTNVYYGATVKGNGNFGPINLLDGGTLAISRSGNPVSTSLTVSGGSISGSGQTAEAATIHNAYLVAPNPTDLLVLSGDLNGDGSITKLGTGRVMLSGGNRYTGGTLVDAGTLILASNIAIADGTSLSVGVDAALIFDSSRASSAVNAYGAVAVPEPSTLALLGVVVLGLIGQKMQIGRFFFLALSALLRWLSPSPSATQEP